MIRDYKELTVWQKAMDLVVEVYRIVKLLPREETYGLSDQMRNTRREYINFLYMARGSNAELQTQCLICARIHYIDDKELIKALALSDEVGRMINAMIALLINPNP